MLAGEHTTSTELTNASVALCIWQGPINWIDHRLWRKIHQACTRAGATTKTIQITLSLLGPLLNSATPGYCQILLGCCRNLYLSTLGLVCDTNYQLGRAMTSLFCDDVTIDYYYARFQSLLPLCYNVFMHFAYTPATQKILRGEWAVSVQFIVPDRGSIYQD